MMDLKTRLEVLPCGKCEDMMDCDLCIFQKEAKELYQQIRAVTIEEVKELIRIRLVDNLCLANATKYGNKNAAQQSNSYATIMKYEIVNCIDDLFDDLEELKGDAENG